MLNSTICITGNPTVNEWCRRQRGYTLLEILLSVTLMLMLMYGVANIFSRVGSVMNETQSTMEMSNSLRNARDRLESDLTSVSVPLTPPRNSNNNEGYFCYIEGQGVSLRNNLYSNNITYSNIGGTQVGVYTPGQHSVALDSDRGTNVTDTTVGDSDDILMFTAKAPAGKYFRGRVGDETMESEYAEIVWFLRGTTLYRRILLILPNELLQSKLNTVDYSDVGVASLNTNTNMDTRRKDVKQGYGFFRFYDVSVHLDSNGYVIANTLADLSNRANRYGYWQTMNPSYSSSGTSYAGFQFSRGNNNYDDSHGLYDSWYWLRLPTKQESATYIFNNNNAIQSFRAGEPFGQYNRGTPSSNSDWWPGWYQTLQTSGTSTACALLPNGVGNPFIDYWVDANCWSQVDMNSGDLTAATPDTTYPIFTQDVILTNVLSFDVKVWDDVTNKYVDLGAVPTTSNKGFLSRGVYSFETNYWNTHTGDINSNTTDINRKPFLPCIFDTWTEQYEIEYLKRKGGSNNDGLTATDIPLQGQLATENIPDFPPPYSNTLKALQVELRVFDPRSGNIRNMTLNVDYSAKNK